MKSRLIAALVVTSAFSGMLQAGVVNAKLGDICGGKAQWAQNIFNDHDIDKHAARVIQYDGLIPTRILADELIADGITVMVPDGVRSAFDKNGKPTREGVGAYISRSRGQPTAGISVKDAGGNLVWLVGYFGSLAQTKDAISYNAFLPVVKLPDGTYEVQELIVEK